MRSGIYLLLTVLVSLRRFLSQYTWKKGKIIIIEDNKNWCPFKRNGNFETGFTVMRDSAVRVTSICHAWCYLLCLIIQLLVADTIYNFCFPTLGFWILQKSGKTETCNEMHDIHRYQVQSLEFCFLWESKTKERLNFFLIVQIAEILQ